MASSVEEMLDELFVLVDEAKNATFSSDKCILERTHILDLIDDIRDQFPIELSEAKKIMSERNSILNSAKREAETIRKDAELKARQLLAEDVIALQGRQKANEMIQSAEEKSRELRRAAYEYCEDALRRTEEAVAEAYDEIKKSRARFRAGSGVTPSTSSMNAGRSMFDAAADEG